MPDGFIITRPTPDGGEADIEVTPMIGVGLGVNIKAVRPANPPIEPPILLSATVAANGDSWTLIFDRAVDAPFATMTVTGGAWGTFSLFIFGNGTSPTCSPLGKVYVGETPLLAFAGAGIAGDPDGINAAAFSDFAVTNNSELTLPTVTGLDPATGPEAGGTEIVITGTGLSGTESVAFGMEGATFVVDSDTQITATSPAGTGAVNVRVTTAAGTSATAAGNLFTYT